MGGKRSKVFAQKTPSSGEAHRCHINPRSNGNAAHCGIFFSRSNPGRSTVVVGAAAMFAKPEFEPPTKKSAVGCITIRPLLALTLDYLCTACSRVCH